MKTLLNYLLFPLYLFILIVVLLSIAICWVIAASKKEWRGQVSWDNDEY